ncbi:MAG: ABC transporter ATP-binding protein [Fervidicoccaceae archaeon]
MEVEMREISKRFGEVQALDEVSLKINAQEIVGLVGENGAGKTTLMNILYGLYRADRGKILINGKEVNIQSPKDAISRKIFMVHQHFKLVRNFTALENIILGTTSGSADFKKLNIHEYRERIEKLMDEHKLEVPLDEKVKNLPAGTQQRIEILKALYRSAELLILDEPTTNLTPQETDELLRSVLEMKKRGISVVLITHKIREIVETVDRLVVLRRGKLVGELKKEELDPERIVEMMVGRKVDLESDIGKMISPVPTRKEGAVVLSIEELWTKGDGIQLKGVSLRSHVGEILGIAGVSGNGQKELCETIMGIHKPIRGKIIFKGKDISGLSIEERIEAGFRFIPEDRIVDGSLPTMTLSENLILGYHTSGEFQRKGVLLYNKINELAKKAISEYEIRAPNEKVMVGKLSGGNIQKVVVARALLLPPELLIAYNPTRGLDVGATEKILKKLVELRNAGASVIFVSEDLDELMLVSDRIAVMYKGEIMGVLRREEFDKSKIGLLMAGLKEGGEKK